MEYFAVRSDEEARAVAALARKVFGPGSGIIVPAKPKWAVYAQDGSGLMVGGVILKKIGKSAGMIDFIFVDKPGRGRGLGPQLLERGLVELSATGCGDKLALIRDDNTPSWNMFAERGFYIPSYFRGIFPYSLGGFLYLFLMTFANTGYSLWLRSDSIQQPDGKTTSPTTSRTTGPTTSPVGRQTHRPPGAVRGIAVGLLIAAIAALGVGRFGRVGADWLLGAGTMIIGTTLVRMLVSFPFARAYGKLGFQNAHGGGFYSVFLGLLGAWWPHFGMWVPKQSIWHYSRFKQYEGRAALAAWAATLAIFAASYLLRPSGLAEGLQALYTPVLIYQALPFIPFEGMDGYRVFKWNKVWYLAGLIVTLALIAPRFL